MTDLEAASELLRIYDEERHEIGVKPRAAVHQSGDLHYVIHCWVINPKNNRVVLQKRSIRKAFGAGQMDVSCAGHYSADEDYDSTRELREELGIQVTYKALNHIFDFEDRFEYAGLLDREIARVHILNWEADTFLPEAVEEIDGLYQVDCKGLSDLMLGRCQSIVAIGIEGQKIKVTLNDFVGRSIKYYQQMGSVFEALAQR